MKKIGVLFCLCLLVVIPIRSEMKEGLKVFISVDMEGISGVVTSEECSREGKDYQLFRTIMTEETNAAVEGALAAGAVTVVVRDSHGSARNILPHLLHSKAVLIRDWSGGPKSMMEGLDETFDAVIFIGYHAKAGTPDAIIEHTSSGIVTDMDVNGVSLPEAGYNALIAGHYNVPVVFVAGDKALCDQAGKLLGRVETVAVKDAIGGAAVCLHPKVAQDKIREGVKKALLNKGEFKPFKLDPPYTLKLRLKTETQVYNGSFYPGARRTGDWELTYVSENIMEIIKAFSWMRK
ncbi:MAG: M55 family metallopeptidase [Acidobacteria bacterium]|nr:M55 family metallopeptidase [Acidobacteriota bacterium]MCG2816280.1 M55 family metallopeptidase [Candidatus Aminicenantes bacterium]